MKNILIVEDDKALAEGIVLVLQQDGFVFRCCHSAKEARKMLETESFDLVLLDINLPGISKKRRRAVPQQNGAEAADYPDEK